tara:strand:+ start:449 stop:634 length:186 start_codon:yes stop_codon:yes gene_type:complete
MKKYIFKVSELVFYPKKDIYVVILKHIIIVKNSDIIVYKCLLPSGIIDLITSFSLVKIKNE